MTLLSDPDIDHFRQQGYLLHHDQLFPPQTLERLVSIFEEHLNDRGDHLSDELDTPHFRDPRLLDFLLADEVLDLVEPLTGPDIVLWSSHFISKDPHRGRATPWHEDSAYWDGRLSRYDRIVTVWLALGPSTHDNGCMRVVPGSHLLGSHTYAPVDPSANTFDSEIVGIDETAAVDFELRPGECSLHDGRIIHGARPNTSDLRRTGYTMRYMPASVEVLPDHNPPGWQVWLARGHDRAGNTYANVT